MSGQGSLLALVAAVATGLTAVTAAATLVRSRQTAFFRYFLSQILLFNLLILSGLVLQYVNLDFQQHGVIPPPGLFPGLLAALAVLKLCWLYTLMAMILVLAGQVLPRGFSRRFAAAAVSFFFVWVVLLGWSVVAGSGTAVGFLLGLLEFGILGGASAACIYLVVRAAAVNQQPMRRFLVVLGSIYLAIFAVMIGSLILGWVRPTGQTPGHVLFNSLFMVAYNLLSLAWILRCQPLVPVAAAGALERYGITAREREIIDQISAGRTNQEIADRLFVSLATVKDHVYNIFRKTGVRNRVELANLMRYEEGSGGETKPRL